MSLNIIEVFANVAGGKPATASANPEVPVEIPFDLALSGGADITIIEVSELKTRADKESVEFTGLEEEVSTQVDNRILVQTIPQMPITDSEAVTSSPDLAETVLPIIRDDESRESISPAQPQTLSHLLSEVSPLPAQTSPLLGRMDTPPKGVDPTEREFIPSANLSDPKMGNPPSHDVKTDRPPLPREGETPQLAKQSVRGLTSTTNADNSLTTEGISGFVGKAPASSQPQHLPFGAGSVDLIRQPETPLTNHQPATSFRNGHTSPSVPVSPQMLATQISTSISNASGGQFEIRLDPPELGRVIVSITQSESGTSAHVSAEKSDIAEFLRRNADILSNELKKSGFGDASLEFSHKSFHQREDDNDADQSDQKNDALSHEVAASLNPQINYILQGGLDIRL